MRIDPKNMDGIYETTVKKNASALAGDANGNSPKAKTDRVEISKALKGRSEADVAASVVVSQIDAGASPEKLHKLKSAIAAGTYHVSSDDIADAMLSAKEKD